MVNRRIHPNFLNQHYNHYDIDYYDDDYNDDYDYYRSTDNDDNDYGCTDDYDGPSDYDHGGPGIYHYDDDLNDYNPAASPANDDYSGAPNNNDDDNDYYVHFAAHDNYDSAAYHDHYVIAADDDDSADHLNVNIHYYEYDNDPAANNNDPAYDNGPAYDFNDPATYYDYNFNYRGPHYDPPDDDPPTLF